MCCPLWIHLPAPSAPWLLHHEDLFGESVMAECCIHLCSSRSRTTYFLSFSPPFSLELVVFLNILAVGGGGVGEKKAFLGGDIKLVFSFYPFPSPFSPPHFPSLCFSCNKHLAVTSVKPDFVLFPGNSAVSRINALPLF